MTTIASSPPLSATHTQQTTTTTTTTTPADIATKFAASAAATAPSTTATSTIPTPTIPTCQLSTSLAANANGSKKATALCTKTDEVLANATCVEFLHLMKAFSESAVNVTEMAQRVESLVHQDEQLLRLLPPLQPTPSVILHDDLAGGRVSTSSSRGSSAGSVADTTDDESSSSRAGNDYGVDMEAMAAAMDVSMAEGMKKWHEEALLASGHDLDDDSDGVDMVDLDMDMDLDVDEDDSDEGFVSDEMMDVEEEDDDSMGDDEDDGASTDADTRCSSQPRISSLGSDEGDDDEEDALHERRAQEDLQRWMELELDLDSTEDPYDSSLHLTSVHLAPPSSTVSTTSATASIANAALGVTAGSHANSSSVLSTTTTTMASSKDHRVRSAVFDRKSMATAALFHDDDEEDDDEDSSDLVVVNALMRKKTETTKQDAKIIDNVEVDTLELDLHGHTIWGMEVDSYEHDLLSSIDHSVLCDRENRFLQWDLEIEAATAAAAIAAASAPVGHKTTTEIRTPPSSLSSASISPSMFASASAEARHKLLMATSPRDHKRTQQPLRSPSNVDTTSLHFAPAAVAEDWSSLDFGTFQNRTVSHILSSCLHKRKLHHPYKDRVTLVNFNVPGGEPIGPLPNHAAHLSSATGSLLFGGVGLDVAEGLFMKNGGSHGLIGVAGLSTIAAADPKDAKLLKTGEKKAKKQRVDNGDARKKQKMLDPFDFSSASAGDDPSGFAGKLGMTKLENLPLPDLTNLPQDLKELKRKIEATEHKVEGTKHRHRKGGPCPRCQVQNQLRAAKRAYHKRAVAHKKLPQLGTVSPALTATAVVVTPPPSAPVAASTPMIVTSVQSPPIAITAKPVLSAASISTPMAVDTIKTTTPVKATTVATPLLPAASTSAMPIVPTAPATIVRQASLSTVQQAPVRQAGATPVSAAPLTTAKPAAVAVATSAPVVQATKPPVPSPAAAAVSTPTPFPRRTCGETALASPFSTPSPDGSTPSSPESASPPLHHVTVTSA